MKTILILLLSLLPLRAENLLIHQGKIIGIADTIPTDAPEGAMLVEASYNGLIESREPLYVVGKWFLDTELKVKVRIISLMHNLEHVTQTKERAASDDKLILVHLTPAEIEKLRIAWPYRKVIEVMPSEKDLDFRATHRFPPMTLKLNEIIINE